MSDVKRYEGPIRIGMRFSLRGWRTPEVITRDKDDGRGWSIEYCEQERDRFKPVRPADDDRDAWALFLPDAPLPDTGVKEIKVGQVWASWAPLSGPTVRLITSVDGDRIGRLFLAGQQAVGASMTRDSNSAACSYLLFDAPDAAPTAAPVKREPVAPWNRYRGSTRCWLRGQPVLSHADGSAGPARASFVYADTSEASCEACAESRGVFEKAAPAITVAEPRIATCGRCAHRHTGPCSESSPGGHFTCPCGHATEAKRPSVEGLFPLGRGPRMEANDDEGKMWAQSGAGQTAREILLANLARERVPGRREIKVAARYAPGGPGVEP